MADAAALQAAAHLEQAATRTVGLVDAQAALMVAARDLLQVSAGTAPRESVAGIVQSVQGVAAQLRETGFEISAANLEATLSDLAAGRAGAEPVTRST